MSDNSLAPQAISLTLLESEWSVVLSALYEAPFAMRVTAPVANKIQTRLAEAKANAAHARKAEDAS